MGPGILPKADFCKDFVKDFEGDGGGPFFGFPGGLRETYFLQIPQTIKGPGPRVGFFIARVLEPEPILFKTAIENILAELRVGVFGGGLY